MSPNTCYPCLRSIQWGRVGGSTLRQAQGRQAHHKGGGEERRTPACASSSASNKPFDESFDGAPFDPSATLPSTRLRAGRTSSAPFDSAQGKQGRQRKLSGRVFSSPARGRGDSLRGSRARPNGAAGKGTTLLGSTSNADIARPVSLSRRYSWRLRSNPPSQIASLVVY